MCETTVTHIFSFSGTIAVDISITLFLRVHVCVRVRLHVCAYLCQCVRCVCVSACIHSLCTISASETPDLFFFLDHLSVEFIHTLRDRGEHLCSDFYFSSPEITL